MDEPPDPGGSVPPAACFVTIMSNESGMDTDGSMSTRSLKRSRPNKMCKHCNKRKRKRNSTVEPKESDCSCNSVDAIVDQLKLPNSTSAERENNDTVQVNNTTNQTRPPPQSLSRTLYESYDASPYIVHVQREQPNPEDGTILHPIAFGKLLQREGFKNIVDGSLKRIGRNRISLAFAHFTNANSFINHASLIKNKLKAFIPTFNVTRMGLVRGVPADWSPEEVAENIKVPIGCGKILKVRRLNFKTFIDGTPQWKPSQTVVITFDGQVLPKRIYVCFNTLPVELYIYPTVQCYNCCRFGHTKVQCRSKPRCYKCGQAHTADSCTIEEDYASCCLCSGSHYATNKCCPEHDRQKRIKRSMAESSVSYSEACKLHPTVTKSYAEITASAPPFKNTMPPPPLSPKSYKKTVTLKSRPSHQAASGYDRAAHQALIKDYNMESPSKGHAYKTTSQDNEEQSLTNIIIALINLLTKSHITKPNNAAPIIDILNEIIHAQHGYTPTNAEQL